MKPQVASSRPGRRAIVRKRLSSSYALLYQRSSIRRRCSFSSSRRTFGSRPRWLAMRASYDRAAASADAVDSGEQVEAHERGQLAQGRVGLVDLDRVHAEGARGLEVEADVVEERRLGRGHAELAAGELIDPRVGLAKPDRLRFDHHVEVRL